MQNLLEFKARGCKVREVLQLHLSSVPTTSEGGWSDRTARVRRERERGREREREGESSLGYVTAGQR